VAVTVMTDHELVLIIISLMSVTLLVGKLCT